MTGLDPNVLACYYIDDAGDPEAERQRLAARRLIESGQALMVAKTVVLELEWVMRGYYGFSAADVAIALRHRLGLPHVSVEDRGAIEQALDNADAGLDFADALHHASDKACAAMATFDDRKFARRARRLGMTPTVSVPS